MSTIHATAVLIGERALLIRGAAGAGKSALALSLIREAQNAPGICVHLIADDRVHVERANDFLLARTPAPLAGMIEERGKGILNMPHSACGVIAAVLDLTEKPPRLPAEDEHEAEIAGLKLPRFFHIPRAPLALLHALEMVKKANISR